MKHGLKAALTALAFLAAAPTAYAQNQANVEQAGYYNGAGVLQSGRGLTANVTQNGNVNTARVVQRGNSSTAAVAQNGDANSLCLIQRGDNLNASFAQSGGESGAYVQTAEGVRRTAWRQRCSWVPSGTSGISSTAGRAR